MSKKTKVWLILATLSVLIGGGLFAGTMIALDWDFTKLSTSPFETNAHDITAPFHSISVISDTADVVFLPAENGAAKVICHEQATLRHAVSVSDDTLMITLDDTRTWYEHIGIQTESPTVTVYLPQNNYNELTVNVSTGDIKLANANVDSLAFTVSTGDIHVENVRCRNFASVGNTGDLSLAHVIADDTFTVKRSTGDVTLEACDAASMTLTTSTGDVRGTLCSGKTFSVTSDTGEIEVPPSVAGGTCSVTTSTGDIDLGIAK